MKNAGGGESAHEGEIVADKNGQTRANLKRHGLVIAGAQAECGHAIPGLAIRKLEHAEEYGAVAEPDDITVEM